MSEMVPMYGFGGGGSGAGGTLTVTAPAGVTVTVSKGGKTKTKVAGSDGIVVFKGLAAGAWTVTITDGSQTAQKVAAINTDYALVISFNTIPEFTYTGDYEIVNDADEPITASQDNWKIRFLTSGTLTFTALNGAENGIDVFLVGGGGSSTAAFRGAPGGAGGGYTRTEKTVIPQANTNYEITIGSGASPGDKVQGGTSEAFGYKAAGGYGTSGYNEGGAGGSGGGAGGQALSPKCNGAADGNSTGGKGQRDSAGPNRETGSTREFGESSGKLYAGGGAGYGGEPGDGGGGALNKPGQTNTGGGAGGNSTNPTTGGYSGGSGIVIIRNAREVA